jgi:hypothetical protein
MELRKQTTATTECAHHWRIAPPAGAYSKGVCAKCGVEREFPNSSEVSGFGYGRTKPRPVI